jgi:hypothetical protein
MLRSTFTTVADYVSPVVAALLAALTLFVILGVFGLGLAIFGSLAAIGFVVVVSARGNPQKDLT